MDLIKSFLAMLDRFAILKIVVRHARYILNLLSHAFETTAKNDN